MMKPLFFLALLACLRLSAQPAFNDSIAVSRRQFDLDAMTALGAFGAVNITAGFIGAHNTTGETSRFWKMNAYWGMVNFGLAAFNYIHLRSIAEKRFSFAQNFRAQQTIEKIYLINFGLDITYITAGILLASKGQIETNPDHRDQLRGYGKSIALQGAFLLVMDGIMLGLHHRNTRRMSQRLQRWEITAAPGTLGLSRHF